MRIDTVNSLVRSPATWVTWNIESPSSGLLSYAWSLKRWLPRVGSWRGAADGWAGDHVLLAPPFIVDEATIDAIVERLGESIEAAIAKTRSL
jgi:hypothetical protein